MVSFWLPLYPDLLLYLVITEKILLKPSKPPLKFLSLYCGGSALFGKHFVFLVPITIYVTDSHLKQVSFVRGVLFRLPAQQTLGFIFSILLFCDNVTMSFSGPRNVNAFNGGDKQGRLYLTTHRMIFNNKKQGDPLMSFSFPFIVS